MAESNINIIKAPLIEQGKTDKQEVQTSTQDLIKDLKLAATNFLEQIDTIIASAKNIQDNTEAIQNHQMNLKEYYNKYVDAIQKRLDKTKIELASRQQELDAIKEQKKVFDDAFFNADDPRHERILHECNALMLDVIEGAAFQILHQMRRHLKHTADFLYIKFTGRKKL